MDKDTGSGFEGELIAFEAGWFFPSRGLSGLEDSETDVEHCFKNSTKHLNSTPGILRMLSQRQFFASLISPLESYYVTLTPYIFFYKPLNGSKSFL